jgi:hypothetical protein
LIGTAGSPERHTRPPGATIKHRRRRDDTREVTTTTGAASAGAAVSGAAVSKAGASAWPDGAFEGYPHVATCPNCRRYALEWNGFGSGIDLVAAALAYHASCHTFDPLTTASQHFGAPS